MLKGQKQVKTVNVETHIETVDEKFVRAVNYLLNTDIRQLRRQGGSLAVTIPPKLAEIMKVGEKDSLRILFFSNFTQLAEMAEELDYLNQNNPIMVIFKAGEVRKID